MQELINKVAAALGIPADKARTAVSAALGFLRAKLPGPAAVQLESALQKAGYSGPIPEGVTDEKAVAEKGGIPANKVDSLMEMVLGFLKDKLPGGMGGQLEGLLKEGGGGLFQKIAGLFGGGKS
jgi:hypothetical protein